MSWNGITRRFGPLLACFAFVAVSLFLISAPAHAAEDRVSLDELLRQVKKGSAAEQQENTARERSFLAEKKKQEGLLARAKKTRQEEERRSERLEARFRDGEEEISRTQELLRNRLGDLGELFGVVRQVAGDTIGMVDASLVSAQFPGRGDSLISTAQSKELPSIEQLEHLWFVIQQEMTESGKVVRFPGTLIDANGQEVQREVIRVGSFTATSDGKFLDYSADTKRLVELPAQPAGRHTSAIKDLQKATSGIVGASVDPARGAILGLLIQKPDLVERIQQGGIVGNIIITAGLACLVLSLIVLIRLMQTGVAIKKELGRSKPDPGNPLGRVLGVYFQNPNIDVETLELKLDEAIVKEVPGIERWIFVLRLGAVLAPLLGLLGTVTGMIQTFQAIMLFGTGDPKVMAGGISSALVTTVLGLTVAIPLTLIHSMLNARSQGLVHILEEQSAGVIARHAEGRSKNG
jgi:biopolymer transport protein ExbB